MHSFMQTARQEERQPAEQLPEQPEEQPPEHFPLQPLLQPPPPELPPVEPEDPEVPSLELAHSPVQLVMQSPHPPSRVAEPTAARNGSTVPVVFRKRLRETSRCSVIGEKPLLSSSRPLSRPVGREPIPSTYHRIQFSPIDTRKLAFGYRPPRPSVNSSDAPEARIPLWFP
jgi:hypothetical protein